MVHLLEAQCMRVHSSVEGSYSPSWTYMHLDFSPLDTDYATLHVGVPFDHNSSQLEHELLH